MSLAESQPATVQHGQLHATKEKNAQCGSKLVKNPVARDCTKNTLLFIMTKRLNVGGHKSYPQMGLTRDSCERLAHVPHSGLNQMFNPLA